MRGAVERIGWSAREAENGRVALERLEEAKANAIILDLMMPEMDGFEFLIELRKREEWRDIPVIVVSALDLSEDERRALTGQVEAVIHKNAAEGGKVLRELADTLKTAIRQRVTREAAR
jgi:CheY-like chemotaxis protein